MSDQPTWKEGDEVRKSIPERGNDSGVMGLKQGALALDASHRLASGPLAVARSGSGPLGEQLEGVELLGRHDIFVVPC